MGINIYLILVVIIILIGILVFSKFFYFAFQVLYSYRFLSKHLVRFVSCPQVRQDETIDAIIKNLESLGIEMISLKKKKKWFFIEPMGEIIFLPKYNFNIYFYKKEKSQGAKNIEEGISILIGEIKKENSVIIEKIKNNIDTVIGNAWNP